MEYTVHRILQAGILQCIAFPFSRGSSQPRDQSQVSRILYQLSQKGSIRRLERGAYPFSSGSSQPRNQIGVSCIAVRFFTNWAIREPLEVMVEYKIRLGLRLRPCSHKMHFKEVLWHDLPSGSQILMHIIIAWKPCLRTYRFLVFTSDFLNQNLWGGNWYFGCPDHSYLFVSSMKDRQTQVSLEIGN